MISVDAESFCDYTGGGHASPALQLPKTLENRQLARPTLKPEKYRGTYVRVRVTQTERAEILRRAKKAKAKNESCWIRQRLLGDE